VNSDPGTRSAPGPQADTGGGDFDLASVLNILWRRRLLLLLPPLFGLLVGVLYGVLGTRRWEATATIRPGITAFDPSGGPVRQWQLKDITRWYEMKLYRKELNRRLGLPSESEPTIRAEFIAQGLQNLQGGDVITLWTTGTSPELAASLLDTSLTIFAEYAEADSVSSQIKLTRDGLLLQIRGLENQRAEVRRRAGALELELESARADSLQVVAQNEELILDRDKLDRRLEFLERRIADLQAAEPQITHDLTQLDHALRRLVAGDPEALAPDVVPEGVRRDAMLDGGSVLRDLTAAKLEVQAALAENRALQDSLALAREVVTIERQQLEIQRETEIRRKIRDVARRMGELELERDVTLEARRQEIVNLIDERRVKLQVIAPVQRVGDTVVSDDPVRPRPLRAIAILVFLGGAAGLVLAFGWDYLATHRQKIFRS
jgi:hypothetical protein